MDYKVIEVNQRWYVAFKDNYYGDFVIEFSHPFSSKGEADESARNNKVRPSDANEQF